MALNGFEHAPRRRALQPDGLAKGPAHPFLAQPGRQVDQHPGGCRDRDAGVAGYLAVEALRPEYQKSAPSLPATLPRSGDHLVAPFEAVEAVARTGAAVAQHAAASREYGREPQLMPSNRRAGQQIDAGVRRAPTAPVYVVPNLPPCPTRFQ